MTPKPRRLSTCHRHPSEPFTGFCALCLRDRLSGLDTPSPSSSSAAANAGSTTSFQPELRRCKSYAAAKRGGAASSSSIEPRRKSCDDRPRKKNSLYNLFSLDDNVNGFSNVESNNLGLSTALDSVTEPAQNIDVSVARVSEDPLGENGDGNEDRGEEVTEEETKSMKEHIEHEWQSCKHSRKDLKDIIAGNFFVKKLRNWRVKQTTKKQTCDYSLPGHPKVNVWKKKEKRSEFVTDYACRRRSCDAEPRFSVEGSRMSLDDHPRFSLDEPRASWDGYMIARTIPRLAPMLSVIENAIVNENETCSDSSSSLRRENSFDCSSSGKSSSKKTVALEVDEMRSIKFAVSCENGRGNERREGFECGRRSVDSAGGCGDPNGFKKSGKWRKGWNILGFMHRRPEEKCGEVEEDGNRLAVGDCGGKQNGEANGVVLMNGDCNQDDGEGDFNQDQANGAMINGDSNGKLVRSGSVSYRGSCKAIGSYHRSLSVAEARDYGKKSREDTGVERNRNATVYSPSNLENGLLRFHLTPSWSRKKSGKSRLRNSDSISTRNMFRLN